MGADLVVIDSHDEQVGERETDHYKSDIGQEYLRNEWSSLAARLKGRVKDCLDGFQSGATVRC